MMGAAINLDRMLTLESVQNLANRRESPRDVTTRLETLHPGFRLLAGPYAVELAHADQQAAEREACVRALRDQRRAGQATKLVMVGKAAYILRDAEGWQSHKGGVFDASIRTPERGDW